MATICILLAVSLFWGNSESRADELNDKYFTRSPFARAQRALVGGDAGGAIRSLRALLRESPEAEGAPQAKYLLGLALLAKREFEEAAEVFGGLITSYPELRDDHFYYRGVALYRWGSKVDAAKVLAQVDPLGPRGPPSAILRGRALYEATDFNALRIWLQSLQKKNRLPRELRFYLAEAQHRTGDPFAAYKGFWELFRDNPRSKFAAQSMSRIVSLRMEGDPLVKTAERDFLVQVEKALSSGRNIQRALLQVEKDLPSGEAGGRLRAELSYAQGKIAASKGKYTQAIKYFRKSQSVAPVSFVKLRVLAALGQARMHRLLGQGRASAKLFEMVADRFPERPESEEALFLAGEVLLALRKHEQAEKRYRALLLKNPATLFRPQCMWGLAWVRFRQGKYEEAEPFFRSLTRMKLPEELHAASLYWLGRTQASLGQLEDAKGQFRALVEQRPLSFYSSLASDLLLQVEPQYQISNPGSVDLREGKAVLPKGLLRIQELIRLGLRGRARKALARFEAEARKAQRRLPANILKVMAEYYEALNQKLQARYIREEYAREYPSTLSTSVVAAAARQAHPLKYANEIRRASRESGVPEPLLFALVRTESNFKVNAVSSQNAYGLAQLILPTAKSVAQKLRVGKITPARLTSNPTLNVRLGAHYLKGLLEYFEGSEVLALAAYNAGPGAVSSWMMNRVRIVAGQARRSAGVGLTPSADELVEEIPVVETKTYVRKVLARKRVYERLYLPSKNETREEVSEEVPVSVLSEPRIVPEKPQALREPLWGRAVGD